LYSENYSLFTESNIYEPLFLTDSLGGVLPNDLCDSYSYDSAFQSIKIRIAEGIVFSSNDPVTPIDIVEGWTGLAKNRAEILSPLWKTVQGYEELLSGTSETVSGFSITDEKTITISFVQPDSLFHRKMAIYGLPVIKPAGNRKYSQGTGPFALWESTPIRSVLHRNLNYRHAQSYLKAVMLLSEPDKNKILRLRAGNYDGCVISLEKDYESVRRYYNQPYRLYPLGEKLYFVASNPQLPKGYRKELLAGIDKSALFPVLVPAKGRILETVYDSLPSDTLDDNRTGPNDKPVQIIFREENEYLKACAEGIFVQLMKRKITSRIKSCTTGEYYRRFRSGEYDLALDSYHLGKDAPERSRLFYFHNFGTGIASNIPVPELERGLVNEGLYLPLFMIEEKIITHETVIDVREHLDNTWKLEQ
jgi:hypothetical protein